MNVTRQMFRVCSVAVLLCSTAYAEDWPTYRHDVARSGITSQKVAPRLVESWVFRSRHSPRPAWGDPKPGLVENILELRRNHFDDAMQPIVVGGAVCFGSSADNKVTCLDLASGKIRWTRILGGPIRLAPMAVGRRIYLGCDDGYAYCLDAEDGSIAWRFRAAPEDRRVLGHGKMMSLWPLRSGVLVDDGVAYFSAGIFPAEGVFFYAVDADDGSELWRNDTCGETAQSKISPQGYMLATKASLFVPMGRVSPAAFDRSDGRLLRNPPFFGKTVGGTYALLAGDSVYTGTEEIVGYQGSSHARFASFPGRKMVVDQQTAYLAGDTQLAAIDRRNNKSARWKIDCPCHDELILAGDTLLAGGQDRVVAIDASSGKQVWTAEVDGAAKGLAVADGRLLVSTDKGLIYCFAPADSPRHGQIVEPVRKDPFAGSATAEFFSRAAETILDETGVSRGYCLVWGIETGQLALELARRSELMIYAVSPDAEKVAAARKKLDEAGVYGARVCVEQWPLDKVPYADYFANLIVSESMAVTAKFPTHGKELMRMVKPIGGVMMLGHPAELAARIKLPEGGRATFGDWEFINKNGIWAKTVRGPLPGAGSWTHQYAEPGNTACGDDRAVKCPLGVLWFGHPGPGQMVNRHSRAAGPLSIDGRLFVQGENVVMAYDAYNGLKLWQRDLPGAIRVTASHDSSNLALRDDGLFVAIGPECLRLDPATGKTLATYRIPPDPNNQPCRWGYVACVGDTLFGSRTPNMRYSNGLFAIDISSGELRWSYDAKQIPNNTIAIGDGRVHLVSSNVTDEQRLATVEEERRRLRRLSDSERAKAEKLLAKADVRMVVALDAETGKTLWERPAELNRSVGQSRAGSMTQAAMYRDGVLVLFGVYLDGHYWQQFFAGEFETRRITAISGEDGKLLWSKLIGYRVRPLIVGDTLHAEPWAFDLRTGEQRTREHPVTGQQDAWQFARPGHHCGCPAASPNCLFFRSYTIGYYDLLGDYGTMHFGAQRPGCWINFIPAGGLLMVPEASAGCMCPFPNMCTIVFKPSEENKAWAWYSAPGPMTPVKHFGINFAAGGDRRDGSGRLWLAYPRPYQGRLVLPMKVDTSFWPGGGYVSGNSVYGKVGGTADPWLFTSAARGLRKCAVPLLAADDGTALFRVRLAMADPQNDQPGRRVFDIKLQGKLVEKGFDLVREAGGRHRAVIREFDGVEVTENLTIELVPQTSDAAELSVEQLPILQAVEIIRQRMLTPGCSTPRFLLSSLMPKQSDEIKLANLGQQPIRGTLQLVAPEGFDVSPKRTEIKLAAGERTAIAVEASVTKEVPAGDYELGVRFDSADGSIEVERKGRIEHLGRRGRVVLRPVEDAFVHQRRPDRKTGGLDILLIDGGDRKMGDRDHAQAYLKFRIDVPGKPVDLRLRIVNAGNPTGDSGRICLVDGQWSEGDLIYGTRPKVGKELIRLGPINSHQVVEVPLKVELSGKSELSLVIDPTGCDGVDYISRDGARSPELIVEFVP